MFVIEKLIDDHHRRVEAWEHARDKWVSEGSEYNYRTRSEYEDRHPRPGSWVKPVVTGILIACVVAGGVTGVVWAANKHEAYQKAHPKAKVAEVHKAGENCQKFNIDDHVRIQYGDYMGDTGKIIGGCNRDEDYQVKLDPGMKANVSYDGSSEPANVGGQTISVDSDSNLVVVKE